MAVFLYLDGLWLALNMPKTAYQVFVVWISSRFEFTNSLAVVYFVDRYVTIVTCENSNKRRIALSSR